MKYFIGSLLALAILADAAIAQKESPRTVLPVILYRDHIIATYYLGHARDKSCGTIIRPLDDQSLKILFSADPCPKYPRDLFESSFIRGRVLVDGSNLTILSSGSPAQPSSNSTDWVHYRSAERLLDAKLINVEPNGEPVKSDGFDANPANTVWVRITGLPNTPAEYAPGDRVFLHTAYAADGDRDIIIFDLYRTIPQKGKPPLPLNIDMTRITPEEKARTGAFGMGNWGKPEQKDLGQLVPEFNEPFQAYVLGEAYYFLTKSGSVYRSSPAEKGKARTMAAVWDNKKQPPVRFIISDGNRSGVHFLIYYREKIGWEYFQFAPEPKPQLLTNTIPDETDTPVEKVYDLARVLRDKKLIVTPK